MLAGQPGMSVAQAKSILAAAAPADTTSTADRILALEEAGGRETLAQTLAAMPEMTVNRPEPFWQHRRSLRQRHFMMP